ncbi:HAD-IIIA family hydrolase [Candidatus Pseudothioglobus singularis]|nr:HAD-IIIA family hydrolase [Candidatus Pseudothioglobus singularis]
MDKPQQAVILCGGKGTRLLPYTKNTPKPMIDCNAKPFLFHLLTQLHEQGIRNFVLLTGYLSENIENYFKDGSSFGWKISYSDGPVDWKTGRRLWEAKDKLDETFLLLYSDNFTTFSLDKAFSFHCHSKKSLTFVVSSKTSGNISLEANNTVKEYNNSRSNKRLNYVEIGYMVVEKEKTFSNFESPNCSFSLILAQMARNNEIAAFIQQDQYHSISDPKRWKIAEQYLKPKKIILIDRDGVINKKAKQGEYISKWSDFKWIEETRIAMKLLAKEGFRFIVLTNQAGVARGMIDPLELERIHQNMTDEFKKDDIDILNVYLCPHHWEDNCKCRKPNPGMLYQASFDWSFRLDKTIFIGDDIRDCQAAFHAGTKSIFIGKASELNKIPHKMQPIFSTINLDDCVSNIIDYF